MSVSMCWKLGEAGSIMWTVTEGGEAAEFSNM
jgi:hypothetical protein